MAKVALLIGVSAYPAGLSPLPSAVLDVDALQRVLVHPEMGVFQEADVRVLKNPQRQAMEEAIEDLFAGSQKDDLALLYFSGHGIKDYHQQGKLYLATALTRKDGQGKLVRSTAVAANWLHDSMLLSSSRRQVIVLDCCYSGAIAKGMDIKDDGALNLQAALGGTGRAILTSSDSTEYSFSADGVSVYTRYLVEGIEKGAADADGDGWIAVAEWHDYAAKRVKEVAPAMSPQRFFPVDEGYKIIVAKSPKDDPKLKFRKEVQKRVEKGRLSIIAEQFLEDIGTDLGLSPEVLVAIVEEELQPYREYQRKLQKYEQTLAKAVKADYPFRPSVETDLKDYRKYLGLLETDIAVIEARVLPVVTPRQMGAIVEALGNGITLEMVAIPEGRFLMGSPDGEAGRYDNEGPQHEVSVQPFYMGRYVVTQAQYEAIMGTNPSNFKGADRPVEQVSWDDAQAFCQKLSAKTGKPYRLPSEAEWEYACRAGTTTAYYFGDDAAVLGDYAWFPGNSGLQTHPVGQKKANAFGLYDMHGNVWEWCQDHWHENYKGAPINGRAWLDENDNHYHMIRGGSWGDDPWDCRSASRYRDARGYQYSNLGFRVALSSG